MRIESLKYFVAVADCRSMTLAGTVLHISQQCISREIKNLEEELGVKLFIRYKTGVELTSEGEIIYKKAEKIISALDDLKVTFVENKKNSYSWGIYRGYHNTIKVLLESHTQSMMNICLDEIYYSTERLLEGMQRKTLDMVLTLVEGENGGITSVEGYEKIVLDEEKAHAVLNNENNKEKKFILSANHKYKWLFYSDTVHEIPLYQKIVHEFNQVQILYKGNNLERIYKSISQNSNSVLLMTPRMYLNNKGTYENTHLIQLEEKIIISTVLFVKKELLGEEEINKFIELCKIVFGNTNHT